MTEIVRNNKGFTLAEMIVVMAIFVVVIALTGEAFNRVISKALSQTKSAESNISGVVGLELMRVDVEAAGYGLFWSFMNSTPVTYSEAADDPGLALNDDSRIYLTDTTQNYVPRPVVSIDNNTFTDPAVVLAGTDVLAVRAISVATNAAARKWSYVESEVLPTGNPGPQPHSWNTENLASSDRVVVVQPIGSMKAVNQLVAKNSTGWSAAFNNYSIIGKPTVYNDAEKKSDTYIIFGVDSDTNLRMPFNRADYYVRRPASGENGWIKLPQRCNPSAGVLIKGVVGHASGAYYELPLLECVLDMQVVFALLTPGSSTTTDASDISAMTPKDIREQVKEIKIYILTHDGGRDANYIYPNATIGVGPGNGITSGTGSTYNFAAKGVSNWQNYRWRVYQVIARPRNLAGNTQQ
ncbi:MAG: prepilin-type N-terminal cleavage/methylation domain-containing protein [Desulfuromonadaceae bacterium]|nr:prepilin-type N-terminal cleavage/methylation domain-containing protein [Desulfuromonadaceae bacterium]